MNKIKISKSDATSQRGKIAVDEGRDRKAERLLKKASKQEDREIKRAEKDLKKEKSDSTFNAKAHDKIGLGARLAALAVKD